jgi:Zn-dependent peptidase ImmA (M78 family)
MPKMRALEALSSYWDGNLPVDSLKIARALKVRVHAKHDLGDALGSFELINGQACICVNPKGFERRHRFVIAHELGHFLLRHGDHFVDTSREMTAGHYDVCERQANTFALELLMPRFAVDKSIMKRDITDFNELTNLFGVPEKAMHYRLRKLGWVK